ncbi:helix-turn-helix transcriptional regulator [Limnohabitans radicicola]|uniref:Helix-turn-helix domain-containing protein n=1 Tax=Limnohabitans radicicola TaxID=2771427 RepID=A0A927ILZ0_9BURK|nr:helix-turn-helix domain-containing protein [Limnohabitans radicicola]MBD8050452.1 helix-turn-helix domain-containing protein [Limnohabitans radicicola]
MSSRPLSTQELADRLGIPSDELARWRQHGKGPCFIKIGRCIRYTLAEVELYEQRFKSRTDWVVGQLATEPAQRAVKTICGRLRRSEFSEKRVEAIIKAYLNHVFNPNKITLQARVIEDYASLMTLKITAHDPIDGQIEIGREQLTPEILFVDLLNTLDKLTANINTVLIHARRQLTSFDPIALQRAVDQFADMSTRKTIRNWAGVPSI